MVDKIANQRTPSRSNTPLVSPDSTPSPPEDEKTNKIAYKGTELIQANRKQPGGSIQFTVEVIEAIAFVSATEVPGLAVQIGANDLSQERMLKKSRLRGTRVRFLEDQVHIDFSIAVTSERRAVCVAKEIQERVRNNVENMTGLTVGTVNVHVASIQAQETGYLH
jgi:Uncharacterized protein conserved in bacteria